MNVREHMALTLATTPYRHPGRRDHDVLDQLGWTPARHAQVVMALLDRADVEAARPVEVHRLRRLRDRRGAARRG